MIQLERTRLSRLFHYCKLYVQPQQLCVVLTNVVCAKLQATNSEAAELSATSLDLNITRS
eukprot:COSAG02_NODE_7942_length_2776_cov_18.262234_1_plen_60_part_00